MRDSKRVINDLRDINDTLGKEGASPEAMRKVEKRLRRISSREAHLLKRLRELRRLTDRAESFDRNAYAELAKEARNSPKPPRQEMDAEWVKIRLEDRLRGLEQNIWQYDADFRHCLRRAVEALRNGDVRAAMSFIAGAARYEQGARDTFRTMKRLENRLIRITGKEIKMLPAPKS